MKIAFVVYDLSMGGAEKVVSMVSNELNKNNEVFLITFDSNKFYNTSAKHLNLNIPSHPNKIIKVFNVLKRVYALKEIFKNYNFDKIFAFMEGAYMPVILSGYNCYPSIRLNPQTYWGYKMSLLNKILLNKKNVSKIIVPSRLIYNEVKKYTNKEVVVIYNPIKKDFFNSIDEKDFIISIGRLDKIKRFDLLIKTYKKAQIDKKLLIIGNGMEKENLQREITKLGLEKKVFLIGQKKDIYTYLNKAEYFVFMSESESFGNVILESLIVGTPVLLTNVGIVNEIITEKNGSIFRDNFVTEWQKFDKSYKKMKKREIIQSVEKFDVTSIGEKFLNV